MFAFRTLSVSLAASALTISLFVMADGRAAAEEPAALPVAGAATAQAPEPNDIIAKVNGNPITYADVELADEEMGQSLQSVPDQMRFQYLLSALIDRKIVADAAKKKHVDEDPGARRRMAYAQEKALRDFYWLQLMQDRITEKAIEAYYQKHIVEAPAEQEAHAEHILVSSEEEAQKVEAELKKGRSFDEVAKEFSKDSSAGTGGDLGWFRKDDVVPAFGDAVFKLKPGEVSDPIKTQFGWHVIRLIEMREVKKPTLEEARQDVIRGLVQEEGQELMKKLRADADIKIVGADGPAEVNPGQPQIVPDAP